jgi:hypothetical protein
MSILALTSDTLIGTAAAGNIEYNGQFFGTDSNASRAQLQRIVQGTAVASTSGTSIDFTSIPSWVKRLTVMFNGVSTNGTSQPLIRLGVSGTPETTGYTSMASMVTTSNNVTRGATATSGFAYAYQGSAISEYSGSVTLSSFGSNIWTCSGSIVNIPETFNGTVSGVKSLAGVLNMIRITTANGTDAYDAGSINIMYEG